MNPEAETIDRRVEGESELELRRRGEAFDLLVDGRCVMRSDAPRAERALVELAVAPLVGRDDITVLLAGLGMGFTLRALLDAPGVQRVDVVEGSPAIVEWEARHFAGLNRDARHDKRVKLHPVDLSSYLKAARLAPASELPGGEGWLALVLDIDQGPQQLFRASNAALYEDDGIERLAGALRPGGVLATWSPERAAPLLQRLHAHMQNVAEIVVPVEVDGHSALDYVYRARRPPLAGAAELAHKPLN
jgi:spermidine synthase